jgi:signal transduction histidine kinase/CheY-like chemotaxis protein
MRPADIRPNDPGDGVTQAASEAEMRRGFLSTENATAFEKKIAWGVMALSVIAAAGGAAYARLPLPRIPAFIPAYEAALWIVDILTAFLLFGQFASSRSRPVLLLASGYLFEALMVVPHGLTFPGVFSETGLLGAGPQTAPALYFLWHLGFPLFVLAYALLPRRDPETAVGSAATEISIAVGAVLLLAGGLLLAVAVRRDLLPVVLEGDHYSGLRLSFTSILWLVTAVALLPILRRRLPSVLDLWLMVVLVAWLMELTFSALLTAQRFDLGFYAGRVYGLMAASFVLGVLLVETNRLSRDLARALGLAESRNRELIRSREEFARVQRFEAIGQLVGGIAHDFNNLLTVIAGGLDTVLRGAALEQSSRRHLEASAAAARRGERMTQQLLTFARRQMLRPEVVNANEVVATIAGFLARTVGKTTQLTTRLSPILWPVQADRVEFETALMNLVLNARDAMDGAGHVVIETRNTVLSAEASLGLPAGEYAVVSVSDTGSGMTPDVAARAFEPFFTTKDVGKGSGLGLSQVQGFARGAAGDVEIVSQPGKGSTVAIYLPKSSLALGDSERFVSPQPLRSAGRETVLVVEDDAAVLQFAATGLADLDYRVRTATNAQDALELLRNDAEIRVLFSDIVMPGRMNGAQLAVEARRLRPDLKVLLTSGYAASTADEDPDVPEAFEVLRKPYRQDDLASKLRLVIDR